jgi:uncharacterized protein YqgV (UPF0045/DUF77 family)
MLIAFSVTPIGVGEDVGEIVAEAVRVVRASGLPNQTTVEGDWDEVMAVVKQATDAVAARAPRVSVVIKADVRPGVTGAMTAKVDTIERYLGALSGLAWMAGGRWGRGGASRAGRPRPRTPLCRDRTRGGAPLAPPLLRSAGQTRNPPSLVFAARGQPLTLGPALVTVMRRMTRWSRSIAAR